MAILIDRAKTQIAIERRDMQIIQFHIKIFARTERAVSINAHCRRYRIRRVHCFTSRPIWSYASRVRNATQSLPPNVTGENYIFFAEFI